MAAGRQTDERESHHPSGCRARGRQPIRREPVFHPRGVGQQENRRKGAHGRGEELGYRPNVLARAMASGRSRIIGLVVAYLDNYFYPEALEKLSTALQAKGYHVLVFMASQTAGNIDQVMDEILDYQVDGIILASVAMSSDHFRALSGSLACRWCCSTGPRTIDGIAAVTSDNSRRWAARWQSS